MEVLLTHPDTWETFLVYHRSNLLENDRKILESKDGWLNDNLLDAVQQLICKAFGSLETYQSLLNCQKKVSTYFPDFGHLIQSLHDGNCHWPFHIKWQGSSV